MTSRKLARTLTVAIVCASVGGAAGIAGSSAASHKKTTKTTNSTTTSSTNGPRPGGFRGPDGGGMAVHADEVVLNKAGTAYITQTEDSGTVVSVTGDQLVITEGTKSVTYKTVTLTIPSGATISRNGATAALSTFVAGDHVRVTSSSDATTVFGGDKTIAGDHGGPGGQGGHGHGGPPPAGAPAAPGSSSSSGSSSATG